MTEALYQIRHIHGATQIGIFDPESGVSVTIERPDGSSTEQLAELVEGLPEILIRIGEDLAQPHVDSPHRRAEDRELVGQATLW
jgi:hypothetical protein